MLPSPLTALGILSLLDGRHDNGIFVPVHHYIEGRAREDIAFGYANTNELALPAFQDIIAATHGRIYVSGGEGSEPLTLSVESLDKSATIEVRLGFNIELRIIEPNTSHSFLVSDVPIRLTLRCCATNDTPPTSTLTAPTLIFAAPMEDLKNFYRPTRIVDEFSTYLTYEAQLCTLSPRAGPAGVPEVVGNPALHYVTVNSLSAGATTRTTIWNDNAEFLAMANKSDNSIKALLPATAREGFKKKIDLEDGITTQAAVWAMEVSRSAARCTSLLDLLMQERVREPYIYTKLAFDIIHIIEFAHQNNRAFLNLRAISFVVDEENPASICARLRDFGTMWKFTVDGAFAHPFEDLVDWDAAYWDDEDLQKMQAGASGTGTTMPNGRIVDVRAMAWILYFMATRTNPAVNGFDLRHVLEVGDFETAREHLQQVSHGVYCDCDIMNIEHNFAQFLMKLFGCQEQGRPRRTLKKVKTERWMLTGQELLNRGPPPSTQPDPAPTEVLSTATPTAPTAIALPPSAAPSPSPSDLFVYEHEADQDFTEPLADEAVKAVDSEGSADPANDLTPTRKTEGTTRVAKRDHQTPSKKQRGVAGAVPAGFVTDPGEGSGSDEDGGQLIEEGEVEDGTVEPEDDAIDGVTIEEGEVVEPEPDNEAWAA